MKRLTRASLAAVLLSTTAVVRAQDVPSLIIHNARIATQAPVAVGPSAVAVKGEKIIAIGSDAAMLALRAPSTTVIDAQRRRLIPGLNDSHLHPTRAARYYAAELRWDGVPTLAQALDMVRRAAERTPEGQWVRVIGGWSPYQFAEKRMPTPEDLTRAAPDTPVFVLHLYSGGIYNRKGIEVARLRDTSAPEGGTIEKGADGQPTGRILATPRPTILYQAVARLGELSPEAQASSARHFYREINRFGVTSAIDAGGGGHAYPAQYAATVDLARTTGLPLRISHYLFAQTPGQELADIQRWVGSERLGANLDVHHENGLVLEGAGETLVWSAGDFENFRAARPDLDANPAWREELTAAVRTLVRHRWPLRLHATYDETIDRILSVLETVHREEKAEGRPGLTDLRWALDHVETIRPANIARIKALGGGVMVQGRMAFAGEDFIARYGAAAAAHAPPVRQLLAAGIPVGLGTDGTRVASYNPWLVLYWLVSGRSVGGTPLLSKANRLDRARALELFTVGSAWFSGEGHLKGRIAPGQYADMALLSRDYFAVPEDEIPHIESVLTITGGIAVHAAGAYTHLVPDLEPILPAWSPVRLFGGYNRSLDVRPASRATTSPASR
ncbi:amidohydrolase [Luteitalea sp. TBR-22]|uniref:amidohydrolase n=1 Tax=Luteitalea sp. TBR-22 TaxID=2802971 RepID=UPI001AF45A15|nr:amidohydrolase [Luteitalea sp. TBR-22]BCS32654.1 amidohydrolase [Luteitalea sp. TBR-22]